LTIDRPNQSLPPRRQEPKRAVHQRTVPDRAEDQSVRISMYGKGRFLDNIFIERLWRSLKYEEVFIKAYGSARKACLDIGGWLGSTTQAHQSTKRY
jgi:transposase InsO family protein